MISLIVAVLVMGFVVSFAIAHLARRRADTTAAEAQEALNASGSAEAVRAWAYDYANRYPPDRPYYRRVTNGLLPAIRGLYPLLNTGMRDGPSDALLADVSWDRHGAHVIIGTTSFRSANPKATEWHPGIYITHPDEQ